MSPKILNFFHFGAEESSGNGPVVPEIQFCITKATKLNFRDFALPSLSGRFRITLIQYRDILVLPVNQQNQR